MRIKKNKKFQILRKPRIDESYIVKIRRRKSYIKKSNSSNTTIVGNQIPRRSLISQVREEYYRYKFYFVVDFKKLIELEDKIKVRVSVRVNQKQKRYSMFSDLSNTTSKGLVASLYGKNKDIRSDIANSDRDGLIRRKYINPLRSMNPKKLKNRKKLNDRELFGTITSTETVNMRAARRAGKDVQLAQKSVNTSDPYMINSRGFSSNYEKCFTVGLDPASVLFGTDDETPADPRKSGTFVRPRLNSGRLAKDSVMFSMRDAFQDTATVISTSQLETDGDVSINTKKIHRIRLLSTIMMLKRSEIGSGGEFFVIFDLINSKGLILQTLKMKINHAENISDYYAPKSLVESRLDQSMMSNKNSARITLVRRDRNIIASDIYIRNVNEILPLSVSSFSRFKRIKFKRGHRSYSQKQRFALTRNDGTMTIMRAVAVSKTGDVYGGFTSSTVTRQSFVPYATSLYTTVVSEKGIKVEVIDSTKNVIGVCFEKRNVSIKEKHFKRIYNSHGGDKEYEAMSVNQSGIPMVRSRGNRNINSFAIVDENVKEGQLYEYRARLYLDTGITKDSTLSRFQVFTRPMDFLKLVIANKKVKRSKFSSKVSEIVQGSPVSVTFNIAYSFPSTDSTEILDALSAAGLDDLYSDDLDDIKASLNNLIFFTVERYNTKTGETFYLGTFPTEKTIVDDGASTNAPSPLTGQIYKYRATASLVSPEEAVTFIKQKNSNSTTSFTSTSNIRDPSRIATIRTSAISDAAEATSEAAKTASFILSKSRKSFSKSSFSKGNLKSDQATVASVETIMSEFSTGDFLDFTVRTGAKRVRVKQGRISIGSRAGPIVKWIPTIRGGGVGHLIDFFVIIATKQGSKYVAGTCTNIPGETCRFVDHKNKNFIGRITYAIIPVFLDGNIGNETIVGSTRLINRNDKFRRGN